MRTDSDGKADLTYKPLGAVTIISKNIYENVMNDVVKINADEYHYRSIFTKYKNENLRVMYKFKRT